MKMKRAATNKDCGSFFFVWRSQETRSHPAFFQLPLTAKLTAKPVDYGGFSWIGADIRLTCGPGGRHWVIAKNNKCPREDFARFPPSHLLVTLHPPSPP